MKSVVAGLVLVMGTAVGVAQAAPQAVPGKASAGEVSVAGAAFTDDTGDEDCRVGKGAYAYIAADPDAADEDCDLVAGIQLPDGALMRSLRCSVYDNWIPNALQVQLVRVELASGELEDVFVTSGTVDSGLPQMVSDATAEPFTDRVDNAKFAYYLAAAFSYTDFTASGNELRVYGCTVAHK
jgi:hypothetical protein